MNRNIVRGTLAGAFFMASSIIVMLTQFRFALVYLQAEIAGIWFLFLSIGAYVAFFDLGISPTISREIGFALGRKDLREEQKYGEIRDLLATSTRMFLILALAVFMLAAPLGGWFLGGLSSDANRSEVLAAWAVFALGASLNLIGGGWLAALNGLGSVATEKLVRSFTQLAGLAASIAALLLGGGIIALSIIWALQGVATRMTCRRILRRMNPAVREEGNASTVIAKRITVPSLKWAGMSLGAILILQTDNVIIAATLGPSAIPPYEAVARLAVTVLMTSTLIVNASTPFLSRLISANEHAEFQRLMLRNTRYSVAIAATMASFLAVFGNAVVDLWVGAGHFVGYPVLWVFLVMIFLEVHHVSLASAAMAAGHVVFARAALTAGLLNIALSLALVKLLGLLGVALGTLLAQLMTNNWYAPLYTLRTFRISLAYYARQILVPVAGFSVCMLLANLVLRHFGGAQLDIGRALLYVGAIGVIGTALFVFVIVNRAERSYLFGLASQRWKHVGSAPR